MLHNVDPPTLLLTNFYPYPSTLNTDVIRALIKHGSPYANHLREVIRDGESEDLEKLLQAGASVGIRMGVSKTLKLCTSAATESSIVLKGFTPLLYAIVHGRYQHAELLLEHEASATARTSSVSDEASSEDSEADDDDDGDATPVKMGRFSALHLVAAINNGSSENNEEAILLSQKLIDNGLKLTKKDSSHKTGNKPPPPQSFNCFM